MRTRAGVRSGSSPWITTRSRSTRGRSLADRSRPTTRPSTFAVISCARTGAVTIRVRNAATSTPSAGRSAATIATRAPVPTRKSVANPTPIAPASAASIQPSGSVGKAK